MNNKNKRSRRNIKPRYDAGKTGSQLSNPIGSITDSAFGFLGSAINGFASPSLQYTPATVQQNGPISYNRTDNVNSGAEMSNLSKQNTANTLATTSQGAALGSTVLPGIGTAIGAVGGLVTGLLGSASRKRKLANLINKRNTQINAGNNFNQASALSTNAQLTYAQKYGDTTDDNLYNTGKSPINKFGNALVGKGETIVNGNNGDTTEVTNGRGIGVDDVAASIAPQDAILGNLINPFSGNTFAQDAKPITRMEKKLNRNVERNSSIIAKNTADMVHRFTDPLKSMLVQQQSVVHSAINGNKYDTGKQPDIYTTNPATVRANRLFNPNKMYNNFDTTNPTNFNNINMNAGIGNIPNINFEQPQKNNWFSSAMNTINGLGQKYGKNITGIGNTLTDISPILYNFYKGSQQPESVSPDQLVTNNPYSNNIMSTMAARKYNVNPELSNLNSATRRNMYNSRQLGSESGINRYMDMANTTNLMNMMSDIYGKQQNANNQYSGELANTMNSLGEQYASRNSAAKNAAYDWNQRNIGAKNNYNSAAYSQLSEWNQGRKKTALENEWMNKYFNLYRKQ